MNNFKKLAAVAVVAAGAFGVSNYGSFDAEAANGLYRCDDSSYGRGTIYFNSTYLYRVDQCNTAHTAGQNGTVVTSQAALRAGAVQTSGILSSRIASVNAGNGAGVIASANGFSASTGIASGGESDRLGVWVSGRFTSMEDDNVSTAYEGDLYTVLAGVDYKLTDNLLVGLSGGFENLDIDTEFNQNDATGEDGALEGDGWTIAPYASLNLTSNVSLNLSGGYTAFEYDTVRFESANDQRITGSTDSTRYFVEGGLSANHAIDQWRLRGSVSYLYAHEEKDSFTESDNTVQGEQTSNLAQARLNTELGYVWNVFEPYAKVGLEYDAVKTDTIVAAGQTNPSDDDVGVVLGGGLKLFAAENITGLVEATTVEARDDYEEYSVYGNLRVQF